jgi:glycosyltransferase involved in cell wall biosynthesis
MLNLVMNATGIAPGGGLTFVIGHLETWREIEVPLKITVFASRRTVLDAARAAHPDADVRPYAVETPAHKRFVKEQLFLGKKLCSTGADVVLSVNYCTPRCSLPQLVSHQNLWRFLTPNLFQSLRNGLGRFMRDWAGRSALRHATVNTFLSDYLRLAAQQYVPESEPRNFTVYNGVSSQVIAAAQTHERDWNGQPHLTAITSDAPHKENPTLIRTLAELVRMRPDVPWRASVAGAGTYSRERQLATELGVADRIEWLGFLDSEQLDALLRRSACMVFPSVLESFGIPLIEAMARRCPPIARRCTAIPEVAGDAALLLEPGSPEQFADAVIRVCEERQVRDDLVRKGLARVPSFNWPDSSRKMFELLESIAR